MTGVLGGTCHAKGGGPLGAPREGCGVKGRQGRYAVVLEARGVAGDAVGKGGLGSRGTPGRHRGSQGCAPRYAGGAGRGGADSPQG